MSDNAEAQVFLVNLDKIYMDSDFNSRGSIAPASVIDLARSIDQDGLIQPIVIAPLKDNHPMRHEGKEYLVIAGHRRTVAHKVLKRQQIPAIIRPDMKGQDLQARVINLKENLNRKSLTTYQEAKAIEKFKAFRISEHKVADLLGVSRGWVQIRFCLLKLPEEVQLEVMEGRIQQQHIKELYSIYRTAGKEATFNAVKRIKDHKKTGAKQALSVNPNRTDMDKAMLRRKGEMLAMMHHMRINLEPGLHTSVLAWAAGNITIRELYTEFEAYAQEHEIDYEALEGAPF